MSLNLLFTNKIKSTHHRLGQDARKYDSRDGIGRVESGTETENNAGAIVEAQRAQSFH